MLRLIRVTNIHHTICLPRQALQYPPTISEWRYGPMKRNLAGGMNGTSWCRGGHHSCVNVPDPTLPNEKIRIISTIKREKLRAVDYIDLTGRRYPIINIPAGHGDTHAGKAFHDRGRFASVTLRYSNSLFPENSKGFLYFHLKPGRPSLSGELRFRITPNNDPGSFDEGYDMVRQDGFHWRMQLQRMPESLCNLAVHDGLVTPSVLAGSSRSVKRSARGIARPVHTLDRNRLQFSDSFRHPYNTVPLHVPLGDGKSAAIRTSVFSPLDPYRQRLNSYGILYYHKPPDLPDTAGEIRIRLTPTQHPASWDEGHDLKRPSGRIWGITLFEMLSNARIEPLLTKLIDEELITPALVSRCRILMGTSKQPLHTNILHHLRQPFLFDFSKFATMVHIVGRDRIWRYRTPYVCAYQGQEQFRGKAWVRFEKSQAEIGSGKRVVTLRLLDRAELAEAGIEDDNWGTDPPYGSTVMRMKSARPWEAFTRISNLGDLWADM